MLTSCIQTPLWGYSSFFWLRKWNTITLGENCTNRMCYQRRKPPFDFPETKASSPPQRSQVIFWDTAGFFCEVTFSPNQAVISLKDFSPSVGGIGALISDFSLLHWPLRFVLTWAYFLNNLCILQLFYIYREVSVSPYSCHPVAPDVNILCNSALFVISCQTLVNYYELNYRLYTDFRGFSTNVFCSTPGSNSG